MSSSQAGSHSMAGGPMNMGSMGHSIPGNQGPGAQGPPSHMTYGARPVPGSAAAMGMNQGGVGGPNSMDNEYLARQQQHQRLQQMRMQQAAQGPGEIQIVQRPGSGPSAGRQVATTVRFRISHVICFPN